MKQVLILFFSLTFSHLAFAGYQLPMPADSTPDSDDYYTVLNDVLQNKLEGKYESRFIRNYDYNAITDLNYSHLFYVTANYYMTLSESDRNNPDQLYKIFSELNKHKPFSDITLPAFIGHVHQSLMAYRIDYNRGRLIPAMEKSLLNFVERNNLFLATDAELVRVSNSNSKTDALKENSIPEIMPVPEHLLDFKVSQIRNPPGFKVNHRVFYRIGMVIFIENPGRQPEAFEVPSREDLSFPQIFNGRSEYDPAKLVFYNLNGRKVLLTTEHWTVSVWMSDTNSSNWKNIAVLAPYADREMNKSRVNTTGQGVFNILDGTIKFQLGQKEGKLFLSVAGTGNDYRGGLYKIYRLNL